MMFLLSLNTANPTSLIHNLCWPQQQACVFLKIIHCQLLLGTVEIKDSQIDHELSHTVVQHRLKEPRPFLNTKYAKLVRTSQVWLGSANSWGLEDTSPVILQMEQQRNW